MATTPPTRDAKFMSFLARVTSGYGVDTKTKDADEPSSDDDDEDEFVGFTSLVESDYHDIWVSVSPETVTAHQEIIDYEIQRSENEAMREHWITQRAPKIADGKPKLSLANALEAFDYQWAKRNGLLDTVDYDGSMCSPEADKFYDISNQLFQHVWDGADADHLVKPLQESLYNPKATHNILSGPLGAREVAETILDLAHAHRIEIKGPNRGK